MRIAFQRTFNQFSEDYLATHYSGGVNTMSRLVGGPVIIFAGALIIIWANESVPSNVLRAIIYILAALLMLYGVFRTIQPLINVFLVWLRRDLIFSPENAAVSMQLVGETLAITEGAEELDLPLEQIKSSQHRTESTWILTQGDHLIAIPREGIVEGDHDEFVAALEELFYAEEEQ